MKLSFKQTLLIIFLILTPILISLLPFFIQSYFSPSDRIFMGLHRWSEDYYGYLQLINQGIMGHLQAVSKLTLEPHQPTFVHSEYVLLGFIGRFFGLNSVLIYHLSRLLLGAIFVSVAFYFLYFLFKPYTVRRIPYTVLAFFLAFFVGGFPHLASISPLRIDPYLPWWTELDVLTRSTILPHYLMGNIFFLLVLILFLKLQDIKYYLPNTKYYLLLLLFSFLLAFVHPIDYLILICSLGLFVVLRFILSFFSRKPYTVNHILSSILSTIRQLTNQILLLLLIFISGLLPVLYYRYALSLPFWRFILAHGTTTNYNIPLFDLSMALGPVFFLGIGGLVYGIRHTVYDYNKKSDKNRKPYTVNCILLLFSWLFAQTLFFLKLYEVFNFDRLRTMEAPYYIALAFFSTIFINELTDKENWREVKIFCSSLLRVKSKSTNSTGFNSREYSGTQKISYPRQIILVVIIFIITLPTTLILLHNQIYSVSDFKTFPVFSYPTFKQYQAWQFLRNHTPDNSAITALYEAKFLIPAVSGNKVAFAANFDNDKNYQNNVNMINKMYAGLLSSTDALNFLHAYHIQYVYWGYQEKSLGGDLIKYPFLQKIFDNGEVVIFKVK